MPPPRKEKPRQKPGDTIKSLNATIHWLRESLEDCRRTRRYSEGHGGRYGRRDLEAAIRDGDTVFLRVLLDDIFPP